MVLASGMRLGSYEIITPLGSGGMGEVYRGRDTRLGRDVAIKILPAEVSSHPDRLRRFEQEARSASSLNHPNIITIYDIGSIETTSYIAMEFVDGKTLCEMLIAGPLPARKVVQIATQLAEGLTKAHEAGIIHRDLKPENIMITKDNYAKILDFGLAKLFLPAGDQVSAVPTAARTDAGIILGTVGYMSPEQASGSEIDFRSDQFSLGAILYESLTGRRAFQGKTTVETLAAILKEDPQPISASNVSVPAPLRWIVERCLEKNPEDRYTSTRDLARDLQSVRDHFSEVTSSAEVALPSPAGEKWKLKRIWSAMSLLLILALASAALYFYQASKKRIQYPLSYHRVTYRRGPINSARFTADGQTIVYSASFEGQDRELYLTRTEGVESRSIDISNAQVLSISSAGEMLILLPNKKNTLAQAPLSGGSPRDLDEDVVGADWTPDGTNMVIIKERGIESYLEYPPGKKLYQSLPHIDTVRFSPNGEYIAFITARPGGSNGRVRILQLNGKEIASATPLYPDSLSWISSGKEVWFSTVSDKSGGGYEVYALPITGKQRLVGRFPSSFILLDISKDGRMLANLQNERGILMVGSGGTEHEFSWLDNSEIVDFSPDGKTILIHERGEGSESPNGTVYIRSLDGSPGVRLAGGNPTVFSPDSRNVLTNLGSGSISIVPTGVGSARTFNYSQCEAAFPAAFLPDNNQVLVACIDKTSKITFYFQKITGGDLKPAPVENFLGYKTKYKPLSANGRFLFGCDMHGHPLIFPLDGGSSKSFKGMEEGEIPIQWSQDSSAVFVYNRIGLPAKIYKVDVATGNRKLFKEIMPADRVGVSRISAIRISPDENTYAYTYRRFDGTLYIIDGLR